MNTAPNNPNPKRDSLLNSFTPDGIQQPAIIGSSDKTEDNIIMHDAKIITPHPYGVYGLCKIIEHLQNN